MTTYTKFEQELLVAAYLLAESTGREIVKARDIIDTFRLEQRGNWVRRAIQSYTDYGYSRGRMHMGDELDQVVFITAEGVKEAERLIEEGLVSESELRKDGKADDDLPTDEVDDPAGLDAVPASDRIVRFDHNSQPYRIAVDRTDDLSRALTTGNDVGEMTTEAVAVATAEVDSLARELRGEGVRAEAFWTRAKSALSWIGQQAAGALVGALALAALAAIGALLGFPIPL